MFHHSRHADVGCFPVVEKIVAVLHRKCKIKFFLPLFYQFSPVLDFSSPIAQHISISQAFVDSALIQKSGGANHKRVAGTYIDGGILNA